MNLKDYNGSTISQVQQYFQHEIGMKFPEDTDEWKAILDYNKLRNNIVHNNIRIFDDKSPDRLLNIISRTNYVRPSSSKEIEIEAQFCKDAINNANRFFDIFYARLEELRDSSVNSYSNFRSIILSSFKDIGANSHIKLVFNRMRSEIVNV